MSRFAALVLMLAGVLSPLTAVAQAGAVVGEENVRGNSRRPSIPAPPWPALTQINDECDSNVVGGCVFLAWRYETGDHVPQDLRIAAQLYEKACSRGTPGACMKVALLYDLGRGVPRDQARAAQLYQRECQRGQADACTNLGAIQALGGTPKDDALAVESYRRGCEGRDPMGCNNLAWMYEHGRGVASSEADTQRLYTEACDEGLLLACKNAGIVLIRSKDPAVRAKAFTVLEKACDDADPGSCARLGWLYTDGTVGQPRPSRAAAYFRRACDGGDRSACVNLGLLYESGRGLSADPQRAVELYLKACTAGDATGCSNAGALYSQGQGQLIPRDPDRAVTLFKRSCELGLKSVCETLSRERP